MPQPDPGRPRRDGIQPSGKPAPARSNSPWVLGLCAGLVLLNFPLLQVFNTPATIFGLPLLPAYLFLVWALLLAGLVFCSRSTCQNQPGSETPETPGRERR